MNRISQTIRCWLYFLIFDVVIFLRNFSSRSSNSNYFLFFCFWKHISFTSFYSRLYLYIMLEIFSLSIVLHVMIFLYHNEILRHNLFRATFIRDKEIVKLNMNLSRSLKVRAEQYINWWISSLSFWSFLQSHLFMMISWFENKQRTLKLLIESRNVLTRELIHHSKLNETKITSRLTLFNDSHDVSTSVEQYESVLMITVGHDIAAQLFYVRRPDIWMSETEMTNTLDMILTFMCEKIRDTWTMHYFGQI